MNMASTAMTIVDVELIQNRLHRTTLYCKEVILAPSPSSSPPAQSRIRSGVHLIYDAAKVLVTTAARDGAHTLRKRDGVIQNSEESRSLVRSLVLFSALPPGPSSLSSSRNH